MPDIATTLTALGAFFGGGFSTKVADHFLHRKVSEADIITRLGASLREEIRLENAGLRERLDHVVDALTGLTDVLDDVLPNISGISPDNRKLLRQRINGAKRAAVAVVN